LSAAGCPIMHPHPNAPGVPAGVFSHSPPGHGAEGMGLFFWEDCFLLHRIYDGIGKIFPTVRVNCHKKVLFSAVKIWGNV
ncbi:MAG TPA: hypothetical protein P5547_13940, partial [Spirochaetota bacterium]|nr:hypothetical protein [Spirochaetota bacterium]